MLVAYEGEAFPEFQNEAGNLLDKSAFELQFLHWFLRTKKTEIVPAAKDFICIVGYRSGESVAAVNLCRFANLIILSQNDHNENEWRHIKLFYE